MRSDLQVVPYRAGAADYADEHAYGKVGAQQREHDLGEGHDADERAGHSGHYLSGHEIVEAPLDEVGQAAADYAEQTSSTSAMNCIETLIMPSPWHSSQRPPAMLNEKAEAPSPLCWA